MIVAIVMLAAAAAALVLTPPAVPILGLAHGQFAAVAVGVALVIFMVGRRGGSALLRGVFSLGIWAALIGVLWFAYEHRSDFGGVVSQALDSFDGGETSVGQGGAVTIKRAFGGEFVIAAKVNDRPVRFVFDTGASTVVLTPEDAASAGIDLDKVDFVADVSTANGSSLAAPTRIAKISIGPIIVRNVRALVTRPGAMQESLLGMSFLQQLDSYAVEKGKLTLRAKSQL